MRAGAGAGYGHGHEREIDGLGAFVVRLGASWTCCCSHGVPRRSPEALGKGSAQARDCGCHGSKQPGPAPLGGCPGI